jgi:hypothetical protein
MFPSFRCLRLTTMFPRQRLGSETIALRHLSA